jgi:ABC-type transport system involved in cytochrome c biogenesis permease subunit
VDRQLRARSHQAQRLHRLGALANLESIETGITRSATIGFVLITIGLITGLIIATGGPTRLGEGWWYSAKVLLAAAVWAIYALVMHVRFVPTFRGRRAAILSIVGLVLLIVVLGISQALPGLGGEEVQSSKFKVQSEEPTSAAFNFELSTFNFPPPPKEAPACI